MLARRFVPSPIGCLELVAADDALVEVRLPREGVEGVLDADEPDAVLDLAARELAEYFAGARTGFSIPLAPRGTLFQRSVWDVLAAIPYGVTWSYRDVASALGRPTATRAVGAANGRNPLPIVIPCHRVIGSDGTLTGFGGGLHAKRWLLALEKSVAAAHGPQLALPGARNPDLIVAAPSPFSPDRSRP